MLSNRLRKSPDTENQEEMDILFPENTMGYIDGLKEAIPDGNNHPNVSTSAPETEQTNPAQRSDSLIDDTKMDSHEPSSVALEPQIESSHLSQSANITSEPPVQQPSPAPSAPVPPRLHRYHPLRIG